MKKFKIQLNILLDRSKYIFNSEPSLNISKLKILSSQSKSTAKFNQTFDT